MSDSISRQAAIDVVTKHYRAFDNDLLELIAYEMEHLPSAQPERKTGRWIGWFEPSNENYHCSACGTAWYPEDLYLGGNDYPKYCPECGAQMENWQSYPEEGAQDEPDKQTD